MDGDGPLLPLLLAAPVVPLAVLVIVAWVARSGRLVQAAAAALGGLGVLIYAGLLADGYTGAFTWVLGFPHVSGPDRDLLPDYRAPFDVAQLIWAVVPAGLAVVAAAGAVAARRRIMSNTNS